jgi:hypothetical protein
MLAPMGGERDYRRFFWERRRETDLVGFRATVERLTVARLRDRFLLRCIRGDHLKRLLDQFLQLRIAAADPHSRQTADLLLAFGSSIGGGRTKTQDPGPRPCPNA